MGQPAAKPSTAPTLADLLADPAKIAFVPREAIAASRGQLTSLDTLLLDRLLSPGRNHEEAEDQLLEVSEAANRLGISPDYLYRHHRDMPFTRRLGRKLLFSSKGIAKYIRAR